MPASQELVVDVAHADVLAHMAFQRSLAHWQAESHSGLRWKAMPPPSSDILIGENDAIVLEGHCRHAVRAPDGGTIHVLGDVESEIELGGHSEVVVSGEVTPKAHFSVTGYCSIFVSGSFRGRLCAEGSLKLWVEGDLSGEVLTGHPSAQLWIGGDFDGVIRPQERASLLWLSVAGFAHEDAVMRIVECRYTQFQASVGVSTVAKGVYPVTDTYAELAKQRSFNRWCVCSDPLQRDSN